MTEYPDLDRRIRHIYRSVLEPLAGQLAFELPHRSSERPRRPTALFLGNHSSGKSSFVNHLLDSEVQKTGMAPTDDGFTIITHGEVRDTLDGQAAASHPDLACQNLERLGPAFLSRLRIKAVPCPILRDFNLIDSPGMIDAVGISNHRNYDFDRGVRAFAEHADLILFFFDPDKPGTTAETVSALTHTLAGMEHKLLIVLNKVDQLASMRDFARSYGALCWNLSKAIATKDIPHIFTTYLPDRAGPRTGIPLHDFDRARNEIETEIRRTPARRNDNLVTDLHQAARKLCIHTRVCNRIGQAWISLTTRWYGTALGLWCLTGLLSWLLWTAMSGWNLAMLGAGGLLAGGLVLLTGLLLQGRFRRSLRSESGLDPHFSLAFLRELTLNERTDLQAAWMGVRRSMVPSLRVLRPMRLALSWPRRRLLHRLEEAVEEEIPTLRRQLGEEERRPEDDDQ